MEAVQAQHPGAQHEAAAPTSSMELEALQVVHKRHWIPLNVLAGISIVALGGMVFGRIPISVDGNAMFLTPGTVVAFQSTATGQIARWHVHVGDVVKKGQLLVQLDQPLINKQLEQARQKLADIESRNETIKAQSEIYVNLERDAIALKKETLEARIKSLTGQIGSARGALGQVERQKRAFMAKREADLAEMQKLNSKRESEMAQKLALAEKLKAQGLRSEDQVLGAKREKFAQDDRSASSNLERVQATLDSARAAESLLDSENRITEQEQQKADLEQQLQELIAREAELGEQTQSEDFARQMEAHDIKRTIARLEEQLTQERDVKSEYDGRVIELTVGEGELASKGMTLGSIDTRTSSAALAAIAYFKMKDGKKIQPGMTIRLTPATVEEARYGGLIGKVVSVSEYPVTEEGLAKTIGNTQAARALTKGDHFVEVKAELVKDDTFSGYRWERFGGPSMKVTAGTIASARANTKEVRPIAFVIPILEDL